MDSGYDVTPAPERSSILMVMRCSNCEARIPSDAGACPECGVFARVLEPARQRRLARVLLIVMMASAVFAATYLWTRRSPAANARPPLPVHVVRDRPGGARRGSGAILSEPEAILRLQRSFPAAPHCIAIISRGFQDGGYLLEAINSCDRTRSGHWRVDGKSGAIAHADRHGAPTIHQ